MQQARLWSGLVLFVFALTHFLNHALGIASLEAMEVFQEAKRIVWRSVPGTILLYGSALVHVVLGLWKLGNRRTFKMPLWEAVQIGLIIFIPYQLIGHILGTRGLAETHGINDDYQHLLVLLWPGEALKQTILMLAVWVHGILGIHFWLRLKGWYPTFRPYGLVMAVLVPVLAQWGWVEAARRLGLTGADTAVLTPEQYFWIIDRLDPARWVAYALIAVAFLVPLARWLYARSKPSVRITYPGGNTVRAARGASLLEISRENGVPHASVCGGRARCSTCRTLIISDGSGLPVPSAAEDKVLRRIGADARVRLACQLRPMVDLTVQPLMPAQDNVAAQAIEDAYHWGVEKTAVIMFADMRNFTGISEDRLPYDVVFLLNRYLDLMSEAIVKAGGHVDKFIGDGIMAIFGISDDVKIAARQAVTAAAAMNDALDALNAEIGFDTEHALRIGIGIHVGSVILGRIGAAGTAKSSGSITALGDTVNAASRLETATKDLGAILVMSEAVLRAAGIDIENGRRSSISVKGKRRQLDVLAFDDARVLKTALESAG